MIFFGHLGLTTGVVKVYEKICSKNDSAGKLEIDYRFVLVGSILPDIIDKPIGAFLFRGTFHNSRIFAHTLLFSVILLICGTIYYQNKGKSNILFLGVSSLIHLILDSMWVLPEILFWPYFGLKFPTRLEGDWIKEDLVHLFSHPTSLLPEVIGFIIILYYFIELSKNKKLGVFIRQGKM